MLIKVKVSPEADQNEVHEKSEDEFHVYVKAKPVRGMANKAVIQMLAHHFNVEAGKIRLIKGGKRRNKIFKIPDAQRRSNSKID